MNNEAHALVGGPAPAAEPAKIAKTTKSSYHPKVKGNECETCIFGESDQDNYFCIANDLQWKVGWANSHDSNEAVYTDDDGTTREPNFHYLTNFYTEQSLAWKTDYKLDRLF